MVIHGITWQYMDIPGNAWLYMLIWKEGRKESFSDERATDVPLYSIY